MSELIKECSKCSKQPHEQDNIYGKGKRLHNLTKKEPKCTVCNGTGITPGSLQVKLYPHIPNETEAYISRLEPAIIGTVIAV